MAESELWGACFHHAVVAISASERQKDRPQLRDFAEFQQRLTVLSLGTLKILRPSFYWDITYWDWCIWADEEMVALERRVHQVLFPSVPFLWSDFCAANGLDPETSLPRSTWRNHKCDVLALWSHIHEARDVFVTNDGNFHAITKRPALIALGAGRIERAETAVTLV
jgi:hypothetical protein